MNFPFDNESETLSVRPLDQISDHLSGISPKIKTSDTSTQMVSTTFVSNGCAQSEDTALVSNASKTKTTINGFETNGSPQQSKLW